MYLHALTLNVYNPGTLTLNIQMYTCAAKRRKGQRLSFGADPTSKGERYLAFWRYDGCMLAPERT